MKEIIQKIEAARVDLEKKLEQAATDEAKNLIQSAIEKLEAALAWLAEHEEAQNSVAETVPAAAS